MPLTIFQGGSPLHKSECEILKIIIKDLHKRFTDTKNFCYLFIGYECNGRQIDATLLRTDAIINIEIKNYSGLKAVATAQGDIIIEPSLKRVSEDRPELPIEQLKQQNYALMNFIYENQIDLFGGKILKSRNEVDICSYIVLRKIENTETTALGSKQKFLRLTDAEKFVEQSTQYAGRDFLGKYPRMNLDKDFIEEIARKLELKCIDDIKCSQQIEMNIENKLKEYLTSLMAGFHYGNYIHRPELENNLLTEKDVVLTGSPGAGKTSVLKAIARHYSNEILKGKTQERIPILLNLRGDDDIIEEIQSNLEGALELNEIDFNLHAGKFWIIFDGIDEMEKFKSNFSKVLSFIKRFSKNRFSISVRREVYGNPIYREYFDGLKKFQQVIVEEFTTDEASKLFRTEMGEQYSTEYAKRFTEFRPYLPDLTPLTIKMAVEIFKNTNDYAFENLGKFYEHYFSLRLKREVNKTKSLQRGTEELLDDILTVLGEKAIEEDATYFPIDDVIKEIQQEFPNNYLDCYNLLLTSEIISVEGGEITQSGDDEIKFSHHSFRDYYVAKHLIGVFEDKEKLKMFFENKEEHNSLVLLCGMEPVREIVNEIILGALQHDLMDLAVDCWCNTKNVFPSVVTKIVKKIIDNAEENRGYWIRKIFSYVEKYGNRIGWEKNLFDFLERETSENIVLKIQWEILKSHKLNSGEVPDIYKRTLLYVTKDDKVIQDFIPKLIYSPEAQCEEGANLFDEIKSICADELFLALALNKSISLSLRVYFLVEASEFKSTHEEIINGLKANGELIVIDNEKWMWVVVGNVANLQENESEGKKKSWIIFGKSNL